MSRVTSGELLPGAYMLALRTHARLVPGVGTERQLPSQLARPGTLLSSATVPGHLTERQNHHASLARIVKAAVLRVLRQHRHRERPPPPDLQRRVTRWPRARPAATSS